MTCSLENLFVREFERKDHTVLRINQCEIGDVGCVVWDAALVLASYLESTNFKKTHELRETRVVELGSGTGIVGLQAAALGAHVTLTDLPEFIPLIDLNIETNSKIFTGSAKATALKWGSNIGDDALYNPDFILIADCVYYEEAVEDLVQSIVALSGESTTVLCCYEERTLGNKEALQLKFFKLIGEQFDIKKIPTKDQDPVYSCDEIHLLEFSKKISEVYTLCGFS